MMSSDPNVQDDIRHRAKALFDDACSEPNREREVTLFTEALSLFRTLGAERMTAFAAGNLAIALIDLERNDEAYGYFQESCEIFTLLSDPVNSAIPLFHLCWLATLRGDLDQAEMSASRRLEICLTHQPYDSWTAASVECFAFIRFTRGEWHEAVHLMGAATAFRKSKGLNYSPWDDPWENKLWSELLLKMRLTCGNQFDSVFEQGVTIPWSELIEGLLST